MPTQLMDKAQAAAAAHICTRNLDNLITQGRGPRVTRIGKRVLFAESDVDTWLKSLAQHATAAA